jgi:hypothetical protein
MKSNWAKAPILNRLVNKEHACTYNKWANGHSVMMSTNTNNQANEEQIMFAYKTNMLSK